MKRLIAEWIWRVAILVALASIAWDLRVLPEDLSQPGEDPATVASAQDDTREGLDALRDDIAGLTQKVNAILVVMARAKSSVGKLLPLP